MSRGTVRPEEDRREGSGTCHVVSDRYTSLGKGSHPEIKSYYSDSSRLSPQVRPVSVGSHPGNVERVCSVSLQCREEKRLSEGQGAPIGNPSSGVYLECTCLLRVPTTSPLDTVVSPCKRISSY